MHCVPRIICVVMDEMESVGICCNWSDRVQFVLSCLCVNTNRGFRWIYAYLYVNPAIYMHNYA